MIFSSPDQLAQAATLHKRVDLLSLMGRMGAALTLPACAWCGSPNHRQPNDYRGDLCGSCMQDSMGGY